MSTGISIRTIVQDEGINVPANDVINFTGSGVTVTNVGGNAQVYIPSPPTGLTYKGLWDANLNSPTLTSSVGTSGDFYIVSVAGTTNLNGITDWQVSDWAIFEGGVWQKIDNHDIQAYNTVKDESTILPQRSVLKFEGTGVTATDAGGETVVTIPGIPSSLSYGLFAQIALSTPVTFATGEQSLFGVGVGTLTVPANAFSVGDSFTCKLCGPMSCANNQNIRIRVKSNGLVLIDTGTITMPQLTNKVFDLAIDFTITKIGGAGVAELYANSLYSYNKDSNNQIEGVNNGIINSTTFNTTIINTLDVTAEWLSNNAANSIRSQNFVLSKVY